MRIYGNSGAPMTETVVERDCTRCGDEIASGYTRCPWPCGGKPGPERTVRRHLPPPRRSGLGGTRRGQSTRRTW